MQPERQDLSWATHHNLDMTVAAPNPDRLDVGFVHPEDDRN